MKTKKIGRSKEMPPVTQWNPILQRLFLKVPDIAEINTQTEIAEVLGLHKSEISRMMKGSVMRQDKVIQIIRVLRKRGISAENIVDILADTSSSC